MKKKSYNQRLIETDPKMTKLPTQIAKKLDQLHQLLDHLDEARIINSDNPNTWDSDVLHDLVKNCQETIKLLTDKKHSTEKDPFGDPLVLEAGLCSLVNEYQEEEEDI